MKHQSLTTKAKKAARAATEGRFAHLSNASAATIQTADDRLVEVTRAMVAKQTGKRR